MKQVLKTPYIICCIRGRDMELIGDTLVVVKKIQGGVCQCNCLRCRARHDSDIVSMNYKPQEGISTKCRMCELYEKHGGYNTFKTRNNHVLDCINVSTELLQSYNDKSASYDCINNIILKGKPFIVDKRFFDTFWSEVQPYYPIEYLGYETDDIRILGYELGLEAFGDKRNVYGCKIPLTSYKGAKLVVYCKHCKNYFYESKSVLRSLSSGYKCGLCYEARMSYKSSTDNKVAKRNANIQAKNTASDKEFGSVKPVLKGKLLEESEALKVSYGSQYLGVLKPSGGVSKHCFVCDNCKNLITARYSKGQPKLECGYCHGNLTKEVGRYGVSHLGEVINHLEVIAEDLDKHTCTLKCIRCGRIQKDMSLFELLESRAYYCDCKGLIGKSNSGSIIEDTCPYFNDCPNENKSYSKCSYSIPISKVLKGSVACVCDTSKDISSGFMDNIIAEDKGDTFRCKAKMLDKQFKTPWGITSGMNSELRVERKSIYMGTDNKEYYHCMCMTCCKMLTLTSEEISSFHHGGMYCSDDFQGFVPEPNPKDLRLT